MKSLGTFPTRKDMRRVSLGNYNCYKDALQNPIVRKKLEKVHHFIDHNKKVYVNYSRFLAQSQANKGCSKLEKAESSKSPCRRRRKLQIPVAPSMPKLSLKLLTNEDSVEKEPSN